MFGYSIPAFLIASFAVVCTKYDYKVAEKKIAHQEVNQPTAPESTKSLQMKTPNTGSTQ